jgi:hypothetical protein
MDSATRYAVLSHGLRWASNILVELMGNHGRWLGARSRHHLKNAISELAEAQQALACDKEKEDE